MPIGHVAAYLQALEHIDVRAYEHFDALSMREFCVNQSCTVLRRWAFSATSAAANQLMQLMFQISARD